ncbi:MAG: formyl-CoA transferase [Pseudomonadota bacterium]
MQALSGVKIIDFTHVQSGPFCTQMLAFLGADVIKIERPGTGDATRRQLMDKEDVDSLYFTLLNHNKRSIELDTKSEAGAAVLTDLIKACDVLVENFAPGAMERMGFGWDTVHAINPRLIMASIKGFGPGPNEQAKVYENVAQCVGGSASTTGWQDGLPLVTASQVGDAGTGLHLALGIAAALYQREQTGKGQKVDAAMQDSVLNLCRVKLRDQQRLAAGPLPEYTQHSRGIPFGAATPRGGNDSGGGQPGRILKCKGWETDPNAYSYFVIQSAAWENVCDVIGKPAWKTDPEFATVQERVKRLDFIFETIEAWTQTRTKFEVMEICSPLNIPVGPVMSMKDIAEDDVLRRNKTVVEIDHPERGPYLSVGSPLRLSDSETDVTRAPLLGEHTADILRDVLGYGDAQIHDLFGSGSIGQPKV